MWILSFQRRRAAVTRDWAVLPVLRPRSAHDQQFNRRDGAAVSRGNLPLLNTCELISNHAHGWTWLALRRQCFNSGTASDCQTPYKARPSQNWQKITTDDHVHKIFRTFCTWFRREVLRGRAFTINRSQARTGIELCSCYIHVAPIWPKDHTAYICTYNCILNVLFLGQKTII
jgi:hypothetical protein